MLKQTHLTDFYAHIETAIAYSRINPNERTHSHKGIKNLKNSFNIPKIKQLAQCQDAPLLVISKNKIKEQYTALTTFFPNALHHYAVKSAPMACIIETLKTCKAHFDVASNGEIDLLAACGITGNNCIHTHPIKADSTIQKALSFGIKTFVFDNSEELKKLLPYKDKVSLLMRLSFSNNKTTCDLSAKFGVNQHDAFALMQEANSLGFSVVGASFHVGSPMLDYKEYIKALIFCKYLYQEAQILGKPFSILDIGGGFPDTSLLTPPQYAGYFEPIANYIETHFKGITIYTEPGRFISATAGLSVSKVIGKSIRNGRMTYYLNDGVYGSFSGILFDKQKPTIFTQQQIEGRTSQVHKTCLFGPTCDSIDLISQDIYLPELALGDILYTPNMGAYTVASNTNFNMLTKAKIIVVA
jgi:ornithine decarboxylase